MRNISKLDDPPRCCGEELKHELKPYESQQSCKVLEILRRIFRQWGLQNPLAREHATFTPTQMHTIVWLGHDGPLTMGELAHRIGITEKTVTGVVDRLERDGVLKRERCNCDRRIVRARLTKKGMAASERLHEGIHRKVDRFLALLDQEDREALFKILEKVASKLEAPEKS